MAVNHSHIHTCTLVSQVRRCESTAGVSVHHVRSAAVVHCNNIKVDLFLFHTSSPLIHFPCHSHTLSCSILGVIYGGYMTRTSLCHLRNSRKTIATVGSLTGCITSRHKQTFKSSVPDDEPRAIRCVVLLFWLWLSQFKSFAFHTVVLTGRKLAFYG